MKKLLYFDEDWDEIRDVYTAWWRHETPTRPAIAVTAPRDKPMPFVPAPPTPEDPRELWLNARNILTAFEAHLAQHFHGGCAVPFLTACLGPGSLNLFLGSKPKFMKDTVWYEPCFQDPGEADLKLLEDNEYWKWTLDTTRMFHDAARGKFLAGMPDLIEGIDILSEVLGTPELLTYLIDRPDQIHRLLDQLDDIYWQAFDPIHEIVKDDRNGNAFVAFQIWGPGKTIKTQCDFAAMISPDMFAEFVCPYMERQCARADCSVYHLDGPSCIRHIEHLVKVRSLNAVQWTPGYPSPPASDPCWWKRIWEPVYAAGKSALVLGAPPEQVEPFLKEFGWRGTLITTHCPTEAGARKLLDDAQNWGE